MLEMTVPPRHFDQAERVEKSLKAKQYYNYSYHKQGDLSTTLEMTVLSQLIITRKNLLERKPTLRPQTSSHCHSERNE